MKTKAKTNLKLFKSLNIRRGESRHSAVFRLLENSIRCMRHGERMPVVRDLMLKFKVSQNTIYHALTGLEKQHLIMRRWGSGIYVNRKGPPKPARRTIGVVVPDIADPFCSLLVKGIEGALGLKNHHMILCNGQEQFRRELDTINAVESKIDGVIVHPTTNNVRNPGYARYFAELADSRYFPVLLVDIMIPGVSAHYIGLDNFGAFFQMAGVIAGSKTNFHRILYLGALDNIIGAERINGFRSGFKEHHLPEKSLKIINVKTPGSELTLSLADIGGKGKTLIVSASPLIVPKLLSFCARHNLRVPEDIVVAGVLEENFHDYIHAPVLGWVKPAVKLGKLCAESIQAIISGKPVMKITKLPLVKSIPEDLKSLF